MTNKKSSNNIDSSDVEVVNTTNNSSIMIEEKKEEMIEETTLEVVSKSQMHEFFVVPCDEADKVLKAKNANLKGATPKQIGLMIEKVTGNPDTGILPMARWHVSNTIEFMSDLEFLVGYSKALTEMRNGKTVDFGQILEKHAKKVLAREQEWKKTQGGKTS